MNRTPPPPLKLGKKSPIFVSPVKTGVQGICNLKERQWGAVGTLGQREITGMDSETTS